MVDAALVIDALPTEPAATTTTTSYPITIDGHRLDNLAWNVRQIQRATPNRRHAPLVVPGVHGVTISSTQDFEAGTYGLTMFVRGTTKAGAVPGAGAIETYRANLDELSLLFNPGYRLLDVRETISSGVTRQAYMQVVDALTPTYDPGSQGDMRVSFVVPGAFWQDVSTSDTTFDPITTSSAFEATALAGSTAPISDATYLVVGPITNPRINDAYSGSWVIYDGALAAGVAWRVNAATWTSRVGSLTLASSDTSGTDVSGLTRHGAGNASYITLNPVRDNGARKVRVRMAGTGLSGATRLQIRARRKFLL